MEPLVQAGIQGGIGILVVVIVYLLAKQMLKTFREAEKERTAAIKSGFEAVVVAHERVTAEDQKSHLAIMMGINQISNLMFQIDGKISTALDLTPVHGMMRIEPSVIVASELRQQDDDVTPVDNPRTAQSSGVPLARPAKRAQSQPGAVKPGAPSTEWGPIVNKKKP